MAPQFTRSDCWAKRKQRRARRALETIAERTGGIAFLPRTLDEVDEISRTVAHDIRNQYTIGYKPTTPKSAAGTAPFMWMPVPKAMANSSVRTRSGYYPGQEHAPGGLRRLAFATTRIASLTTFSAPAIDASARFRTL